MKKTAICLALTSALGLGAASAQAVTIDWGTNSESDNVAFPSADALNNAPFGTLIGATDPDFRVMNGGAVSGGGEKQIGPGVSWTFDTNNELASVTGSDATPGAAYYTTGDGTSSAAPSGDTGLLKNALFLGNPFGFLAPTVGSAAGTTYGVGTITVGTTDAFSMFFPVLEAQWNQAPFTIGRTNGGITFDCTGATSGNILCQAEKQIAANDDSLGFAGQYIQFELVGTATPFSVIPVPAAVWLFGSGLIGLVGVARRKKAS